MLDSSSWLPTEQEEGVGSDLGGHAAGSPWGLLWIWISLNQGSNCFYYLMRVCLGLHGAPEGTIRETEVRWDKLGRESPQQRGGSQAMT